MADDTVVMLIDHGLELLTGSEAWDLLRSSDVGRVGVSMGALPAIFPVNYAVVDDRIVFRTAPGSKLSAATDRAVVAFEVDDYERTTRSGWSVLVVGRCEVVHDLHTAFEILHSGMEPWADAPSRTSIIAVTPEFVSGRRIVHPAT